MAAVKKCLRDPGWTTNLSTVPDISMDDVVSIIKKHSKVPNKHLNKGYRFFHGSYVHDVEGSWHITRLNFGPDLSNYICELKITYDVLKYQSKVKINGCDVRAKCFRSMKTNAEVWSLQICILNTKELESQACRCGAGLGSCAHVAGLVYQLAHYKTMNMKSVPDIISKTSRPQQWQVPPRTHGIKARPLSEVKFVKPKSDVKSESCICSTLYNPINSAFPDVTFMSGLQHILPLHDENMQILQVLPDSFENIDIKSTAFGNAYFGSTLFHQLPEPKSDGSIIKIHDDRHFPELPLSTHDLTCPFSTAFTEEEMLYMDSLTVTLNQCKEIEESTRTQSDCPEWHKLRRKRITSSTFKDVAARRKDFDTLVDRLTSTKIIQTQAMKHGIQNEQNAVLEYATHKNVNVTPCGFVIHPSVPFLGSSPDRIVYDPNEISQFGVLEVKCPIKNSYKDSAYLKEDENGEYKLKRSHAYYLQAIGQMAITGLTWGISVYGLKAICTLREFTLMNSMGQLLFETCCVLL